MIEGLSHITFIVKDLQKATTFFEKIFEAKEVHSSSVAKFFLIQSIWIAILEGEISEDNTYDHVAFKISKEEIPHYLERIKRLGLEIKEGRDRIKEENDSIYFYDYDNHLFELHAGTLEERLKGYKK